MIIDLYISSATLQGEARRTANIICRPTHEIWKKQTFEETKRFLQESFPQIDFETFVSDEVRYMLVIY